MRETKGKIDVRKAWLAPWCLALLCACQPPAEATVTAPQATAQTGANGATGATGKATGETSQQTPQYRLNPAPKQGYEVVAHIVGAPGPLKPLGATARYQAQGCSYVTNAWAGARGVPEMVLPLKLVSQDGTRYVATFYRDAMQDADYFGNGTCHWDLTGIAIGLSSSGDRNDTAFSSGLALESLLKGQPVTLYYLKRNYGRPDPDHIPVDGQPTLDGIRPEFRGDLFTITLTPRPLP